MGGRVFYVTIWTKHHTHTLDRKGFCYLGGIMSKVEIKERAKEILANTKVGDYLRGDNKDFMMDVIAGHPESSRKIGSGIRHIAVMIDPVYKRKCFYIIRTDGSQTDFSYIKAIDGAPTKYGEFSKACRTAVKDQVQPLGSKDTHVHHEGKQFAEIVNDFIREYTVNLDIIEYTHGDNITETAFKNPAIANLFGLYHKRNAKLVAIGKEEHKAIPVQRYK